MDIEALSGGASPSGRPLLVCEPVVLTGGFVLCHEPGDTAVLHVHDHRQGHDLEPVVFIVRADIGWSACSGGETLTGDSIVEVFERWVAVVAAATRMAAASTRS